MAHATRGRRDAAPFLCSALRFIKLRSSALTAAQHIPAWLSRIPTMLSALKAVAALAAAGSALAAPAPIALASSSEHALAARQVIVKPKVMIISMVRVFAFLCRTASERTSPPASAGRICARPVSAGPADHACNSGALPRSTDYVDSSRLSATSGSSRCNSTSTTRSSEDRPCSPTFLARRNATCASSPPEKPRSMLQRRVRLFTTLAHPYRLPRRRG